MTLDMFETPAYKLARRDDPATSHAAAESLNVTAMEKIVYDAICSFGDRGCIADQVCDALPGHRYNSITPRFKALKEKGLVIVDDRKLKGDSGRQQLVMWGKDHYHAKALTR